MNTGTIDAFLGLHVVVSQCVKPVPVLRVSPQFEWCTPQARDKMNAWLLERFGVRETFIIMGRTAFVSPNLMGRMGRMAFVSPNAE